jgi:hypothetical protein
MLEKLGYPKGKNGDCTNFSIPRLEENISCACRCIFDCLGIILAQIGEGGIDHLIAFASMTLSSAEKKYTTTKREGLAMVYALQKFRHYLLGSHFKMFMNHSTLKYLVNKPVLGGKIYRWLLLFH